MKFNRKGIALLDSFVVIAMSLVFMLMLGTMLYVFGVITDELVGGNFIGGQVNISNASLNTVGQINTAFLAQADLIGIFFLFGMIIAMIINGYFNRNSTHRLLFMIDFILLVFGYILAVYISNSWVTILAALPFVDIITANLNTSSRFMLLLPEITLVAGALTMIATYAGIPRSQQAEVAGF